jgi:hypothetical protein
MKTAIGICLCCGFLAALLALDAGTQSRFFVHPSGFEAALVLPALFWLWGAIATLLGTILSVVHVVRQKERFRDSFAIWSSGALIAVHIGLLFVHP